MRKFTLAILSTFLFLWSLCSCSTASSTYEIQEKIEMNYNNISNYSDFWLTNNSICYLDGSLVQKYFLIDKSSKTKIGINSGYGSGKIQRYGNEVYMMDEIAVIDEYNSKFELKMYDVNSKTIKIICSIENCDNFLVLGESIYYLQYNWVDDVRVLTLKRCLVASGENDIIRSSVLSFGVIGNNLFYVAQEKNRIIIFKYNDQNDDSVKCGEFSLESPNNKSLTDNIKVSYTLNNILFSWVNYEKETSIILKYSLKDKALSDISIEGFIGGCISFDTYSYFTISSEQCENTELCMFNNETNEIVQIAKFLGEGSLFVGSDEGAYILEYEDNVLRFYSNEGESQVIYRF